MKYIKWRNELCRVVRRVLFQRYKACSLVYTECNRAVNRHPSLRAAGTYNDQTEHRDMLGISKRCAQSRSKYGGSGGESSQDMDDDTKRQQDKSLVETVKVTPPLRK
jgi:hypothetical protein